MTAPVALGTSASAVAAGRADDLLGMPAPTQETFDRAALPQDGERGHGAALSV
jgi:hypothetical protein